MLTVAQYDLAADQARMGREAAQADDLRELFDVAWSHLFTARQHANLVGFFEGQAVAMRHEADRLASMPGRAARAEATRLEATRLYETALRHRAAAEGSQEKGEVIMVDAVSMAQRDAARTQRRERRAHEAERHGQEDERRQDDVQHPEEQRAE